VIGYGYGALERNEMRLDHHDGNSSRPLLRGGGVGGLPAAVLS